MMKYDTAILFVIISFMLWISSCANITQPTGGPKDTIPPQLISSEPIDKSLNFDGQEVKLTFDEYIKVENINQQLIITPRLEEDFKFLVNKNTLAITFPNELDSSTTYTLNFAESVVDITEGNPNPNLVLAFSTGSYIDSLSISGQVKNLYTNKPIDEATVAIYKANDTVDIFNSKPNYFTRTNETGHYTISNIKNGKYEIYAYLDENKNLQAEPLDEPYGFISEPLDLNRSVDSLFIPVQKLDVREFEVRSARPSGKYFEIQFNKYVEDYTLTFEGNDSLASNLVDKSSTVRVYNTMDLSDSIQASITAIDTIGQAVDTTFYVKFPESERSFADLAFTVSPESGKEIVEDFTAEITFNKPILKVNTDSIFIQYDSLTIVPIVPDEDFIWNKFKDQLTISKELNKELLNQTDSIAATDTTATQPIDTTLANPPINVAPESTDKDIVMFLGQGSFITVDNDTVPEIKKTYQFKSPEDYAIIRGTIETEKESYTVQLLDTNFEVIREIKNKEKYELKYLPPGEYTVRILIDNNNNGVWEPGNIKLNQEPEDIIFSPVPINVRANWEVEDVNFSF